MSLTNVLLIHVSSRYMPRTDAEEQQEQEREYYHLLGLTKYSPVTEIRKSFRRLTLQIQCDRMMLEWNSEDEYNATAAKAALDEKEKLLKEAFHVLGDKHLRQQYHLLQCRPSRYKIIKGPLALIQALTQSRRWFPLLVLQSVIVASMVNAIVAQYQTQDWVNVLIPAWSYYGLIVLFWLYMVELPWRRHCTWQSFLAMLAALSQHACLWNGCFWMARYWDRATHPHVNWFILSIPFYLAIAFRCYCTKAAVDSLRELQSKMISRELLESKQLTTTTEVLLGKDTSLPEGYIAVTKDSSAFSGLFLKLNDDDMQDPRMLEIIRVESSPEWRQVDHAAKTLHRSAVHLATLGSIFITLMALKLEDVFDVSFWVVFIPIWIHLGMRLYVTSKAPRRVPAGSPPSTTTNNNTSNDYNSQSQALQANTPSNSHEPIATTDALAPMTAAAIEESGQPATPSEPEYPSVDIASKSLSTGAYTAVNVIIDVPTQSMSTDENNSVIGQQYDNGGKPKLSLPESVQLMLTEEEKDVEAAIPLAPTTNGASSPEPATKTTEEAVSSASEPISNTPVVFNTRKRVPDGPEGEPAAVSEEFERWQSVYENQEVRTTHFQFIPCEVLFHVLIACLIVAKLDDSYENTSPQGSNFNAFFILLVPFSLGLIICCCALAVGMLALNTEVSPQTEGAANSDDLEAQGDTVGNANGDSDELVPMQAGAAEQREKSFATDVDVVKDSVVGVQLLTAALPITPAEAAAWLAENNGDSSLSAKTIWQQVVQCANSLNCRTANQSEEIPEIPSFDKDCILLLRTNLDAYFDKVRFQNALDLIEPVNDDNPDGTQADDAIECPVCCEEYRIEDTVHCEGNPIHFFCRVCFHRYATETIQAGDVAGMPCADADCEATFATPTVKANLSKWELLRQQDREQERNRKVALAAKAVLHCTCGAVGIVTDEEIGDACISCPGEGCDKQYCALCGNNWHPETSCPPTKKMLQWVVQNTMPCPNCHTPIEKNFGCDHMHCAPPGGCGHHFSYKTGKPMSKHGRNLRGLYH